MKADTIAVVNPGTKIKITSELESYRLDSLCNPHRVTTGAFIIISGGKAKILCNISEYYVEKYDIITVIPGSILQLLERDENFNAIFISFTPEFVEDIALLRTALPYFNKIWENPVLKVEPEEKELAAEFCSVFNKIYTKYGKFADTSLIRNMLMSFIYGLSAFYNRPGLTAKKNRLSRKDQIFKDLIELIIANYRRERSVAFYAEKLCITPKHLSTTVKAVCDKNVTQMISQAVILDAKAQLRSSSNTINEIAYSLNFPNQSFFGKYFRKHTGMSPKAYRQNSDKK